MWAKRLRTSCLGTGETWLTGFLSTFCAGIMKKCYRKVFLSPQKQSVFNNVNHFKCWFLIWSLKIVWIIDVHIVFSVYFHTFVMMFL